MDIKSDMNAIVREINVHCGQRVSEGETLAITEAMKMEMPIVSPYAGVVAEIKIAEGVTVKEGQVVMVLEP